MKTIKAMQGVIIITIMIVDTQSIQGKIMLMRYVGRSNNSAKKI